MTTATNATLDYNVSDQWQSGFVGRMSVTFPDGTDSWRVTFDLNADIGEIWNARIVSHVGNTYVVEGVSYNSAQSAGDTASFGFVAEGADTSIDPASIAVNDVPVDPTPVDPTPDPVDPAPVDPDPVDPDPVEPAPTPGDYVDITTFGDFHGTSSHTGHDDLHGGRTAITTEALVAYNGLRDFLGLEDLDIVTIGQWAFDNDLTNNDQAWGQDLQGVGLYYAMQGAKVGWIRDDAFDPQLIADIQRTARLGDPADVMAMVEANSHDGFADYLTQNNLVDTFINTLKMEPHYGGWMHGRVHGDLTFPDGQGARAHDVNHLTVLSHDQTQPFMNDTFDWPQWSALDVPHQDVIDYFQSMVVLGDPLGDALPSGATPDPVDPAPVDPTPDPVDPDPVDPDPVDPDPVDPAPAHGDYVDITTFGNFHGTSSHTGHDDLHGGRTAITTEALVAYNGLRDFLGLEDLDIVTIGQWAFDNDLTNNDQAWGQDLQGVGLYYAMQGAKVGWIRDDAFDPQLIADIQRTARLGDPADVMAIVEANSHDGFADYLTQNNLVDTFINTLKMEPHYGGWMHGRVHGDLTFPDGQGARAHDVNHLTVLSHDQTQPFMNDTFDWPQWSALDVPHQDVIDYFQSMVVLGDPLGDALPSGATPDPVDPTPDPVDPAPVEPDPVEPDPVDPDPVEPDPVEPDPVDPASGLSAEFLVANDWGHGATLNIVVTNNGTDDVTDWDLEFTLGSDIQHIWNAIIEDQSGDRFSIDDAGWNANIGAGESVTVGFNTTSGGFDVVQLNDDAQFLF